MLFKAIPFVGPRYWLAMAIASMCGANLGDIFMDVLKLEAGASLAILAVLFVLLLVVERAMSAGLELFYWAAILIVRATATNMADIAVGVAHLTYTGTTVILALILVAAVALDRDSEPRSQSGSLPSTGALYWFTMLAAGTLGTVIADGLGHAFGPVQTGVPVSAAMATLVVLAVLAVHSRVGATGVASYWTALVSVCWWGTNVGDISAYLLSLVASTAATAAALSVVLLVWRAHQRGVVKNARA